MPLNFGTRRTLLGAGATYADKVMSFAPIAYWPLWEASGSTAYDISGNGFDGTYSSVTLGQEGIGDGRTSPLFASSHVDVYSAGLRDAFDPEEGSMTCWVKMSAAGDWTDAAFRFIMHIGKDAGETYQIGKVDQDNVLRWIMGKEGEAYRTFQVGGYTTTDWFHMAMTWTKIGTDLIGYTSGAAAGNDTNFDGSWDETLTDGFVIIGAQDEGPNNPHSGWLAHAAIFDSVLSPTDLASLAVV